MHIDFHSETWHAVRQWAAEQEAQMKERLLADLDAVSTARLRAQVELLRRLRALGAQDVVDESSVFD